MKADRDTFGPRLRLERERRGIALKDIAESTKLKESLFAELERSDFSKWPQGIFRRAHLCAYVSAIGLPSQIILAEFLRLFPEEDPVGQTADCPKTKEAAEEPEPRRSLAPARPMPRVADRAWVVAFDVAAICLLSTIVAGVLRVNIWAALASVGLAYSAVGQACFGRSVGGYVQGRLHAIARSRRAPQPASTAAPLAEVRLIASRQDRNNSSAGRAVDQEDEVQQRRASA
jgi:transcriptional regulator with XRE-family HTH domain